MGDLYKGFCFDFHKIDDSIVREFGGAYVAENLVQTLKDFDAAFDNICLKQDFVDEFLDLMQNYVGRPSPLYFAHKMSSDLGAKIYLKREDLNHTGAHKINNAIGQALLAKKMGKTRIIAETGAGQHGVATATACTLLGLECVVYQGERDIEKQQINAFKMKLLGAKLVPVTSGSKTLKDAIDEAMRDWVANLSNTHYMLGSVCGPYPFNKIVRNFQGIISFELQKQILEQEGRLPNEIVACVGGGSNSMGIFCGFVHNKNVKLTAVEAGGCGLDTNKHSAKLAAGNYGIFHGVKSYFLQDSNGFITPTHSISSGLDYPGVGSELAILKDNGRLNCAVATDKEALDAMQYLIKMEGIIPALETSHAIAYLLKNRGKFNHDDIVVISVSGRGDKDIDAIIANKYIVL